MPSETMLLPCPFCGVQAQWVEDNGDLDTPFGLVTEHAELCFLSGRMMADWKAIITAWNTRLASAGWRMVPVEADDAMSTAAARELQRQSSSLGWEPTAVWSAMLTAAPEPPVVESKDADGWRGRLEAVSTGASTADVYGREWCFDPATQMRADLSAALATQPAEVEGLLKGLVQARDNLAARNRNGGHGADTHAAMRQAIAVIDLATLALTKEPRDDR